MFVTLIGSEVVIAGDGLASDDCLEAIHKKGKAELIITPSPGHESQLRKVLEEANLSCVAQLLPVGACLVQIDPWQGQSIDSIAKKLGTNIFSLSGSSAPKDTQALIDSVIVNRGFKNEESAKLKSSQPVAASGTHLRDPHLDGQSEMQALDAETAWFDAKVSNVLTAIIDTGVRTDHEDLVGRFIPGTTIGCHEQTCDGTPDDNGFEKHHGTRVAGILAATKGNHHGGVGVAWNTQFMSINYGPVVDQYRMSCALRYAIEHNADIVNASWTGGADPGEYTTQPWDLFKKYVLLAQAKGMLIVLAAGNGRVDLDRDAQYPAALKLPNMLVVTAYDMKKDQVPTSNYGHTTTHIAAPNHASSTTCLDSIHCYTETESSGTSWSTAYVSGAAALLKSRYPNMDYVFLRWRIMANATPVAMLSGMNESGGRLNLVGTIFPVNASHGVLSRTKDSLINWSKGIRADMCMSVSIEGRPVTGNSPGNYFQIVASTPNDGVEYLPHDAIANVNREKLQLRIRCIDANPIAESVPLPLN